MLPNFYYSNFAIDIRNVKESVLETLSIIEKIETCIEQNEIEKANKKSFELVSQTEKMALSSRMIPMAFPSNLDKKKEELKELIIKEINIECKYIEDDWLYVKIPCLLPKKKKRENANYIRESLAICLNEYFKYNELKSFKKNAIIIFKHNYSEKRKAREFRDHDNIEIKSIIDVIACYSLIDDGAMCCKHFYCSSIAETDSTEIFVIPNDNFIDWLRKYGDYNAKGRKI